MITKAEQDILDNAPEGSEYYCAVHGIYCAGYLNADKSKIYPMQASGWEWKDICQTDIDRFDSLADLRKKQAKPKTVIDAVNFCYSSGALLICGGWYLNQVDAISFSGAQVCTIVEFNQCVDDLANWANKPLPSTPTACFDYAQHKLDNPVDVKRMKVDYVKVDFEYTWEVIKEFEMGDSSFYTNVSHETYGQLYDAGDILKYINRLYRKVETEIKTEKRWVGVNVKSGGLTSFHYATYKALCERAHNVYGNPNWQIIEITVEV